MRRHPWLVVSLMALVGVLVLASFPTRAYFAQVAERKDLAARSRVLAQENEALAQEIARLQSDATIEQLARSRFQLVRPGEEAYAILPEAPPAPAATPPPAPVAESWWSRAWGWLTSVF